LQKQLEEKEQALSTKRFLEENMEKLQVNIKLINSSLNLKKLITENIDINVDQGNALVGNTIKQANITNQYATTTEEITEEFEAQIQQANLPPKTN